MEVKAFVSDDDAWVPAVDFTDREDSLLVGTVSFPLASFLTADGALRVAESADRLIAWGAAMKVRALARSKKRLAKNLGDGKTTSLYGLAGTSPMRLPSLRCPPHVPSLRAPRRDY